MLRPLLINPLLILGVAIAGAVICQLVGVRWLAGDLIAAAGIGLIAAEAAVAFAVSRRGMQISKAAVTALVSMGLQLLLSLVLAIVALLSHRVGASFVWWMLVMFWVTLAGVCLVLVRLVRAAPVGLATPTGTGRP